MAKNLRFPSSARWAALALLLFVSSEHGVVAEDDFDLETLDFGPFDRFWRHHLTERSVVHEGKNYFDDIEGCLRRELTEEDWAVMEQENPNRRPGQLFVDKENGEVVGMVVEQAMMPVHRKGVQSLAACIRENLPHLYESRSMAVEMGLDESSGVGGNCPTHMAPLLSIFLPQVRREMQATLEAAYQAAGWSLLTRRETYQGWDRVDITPEPNRVGIRASEHLTYKDFPRLKEHDDGHPTKFTLNFALSDNYEGGEFYIMYGEENEQISYVKPNVGDALVFLGGRYQHGVEEIKSGHREMFSTEFWPYPDIPFGSNLWTSMPQNMIAHIRQCNEEQRNGNSGPCTAAYPSFTAADFRAKEAEEEELLKRVRIEKFGNWEEEDIEEENEDEPTRVHNFRPNRISPTPLQAIRFRDSDGKEYDFSDFHSEEEEYYFLIPKKLEPGQMEPIRWRDGLEPIDGAEGETFVIGFPPELTLEFQSYVERSGMMDVARKILYDEEPLEEGDQRLYKLDDGMHWTAMVQGAWETDMVWLDPGDEECFESLIAMLRRGKFSTILEQVGKAFGLDGLMIQGVGAIFLSEYEYSNNMHKDIIGSKGSFYNVIVPVHIPEGDVAKFYVGESDDDSYGILKLRPDSGVVLGGESRHGTGECNYREKKDFRLSFAIYLADINEDNAELIASDSTSLWPTTGDVDWFFAQQHRFWSRDGKTSLDRDQGRKPLNVLDDDERCTRMHQLCERDLTGWRLRCPKTCKLYMEDEVYYVKLAQSVEATKQTVHEI